MTTIAPFPPLSDPPLPEPPEPDAPVPDPPDPDPNLGGARARAIDPRVAVPASNEAQTRCACGYDRQHALVRAEPRYGFGAWLRLAIGVSARPERIVYRCRRCHHVVDETTAPETLNQSY